jgi:N-acetylmuramoyl-L-alanine amidase
MNIIEAYLTPNEYSRPQTPLKSVKGLVVHWVANPMSTAIANRNFFESRKNGNDGYGSAHDIIDLNGDLIKCLPYDEMAYQVGSSQPYAAGTNQIYTPAAWQKLNSHNNPNIQPYPNDCTIGVECTHIDWDGTMTNETYESLILWCVENLMKYGLTVDDLYLHKEIVGWKDCHMWFVKNPDKWVEFKQEVDYIIKNGGVQMIQELQAQVQQLQQEIANLKQYQSMEIPAWAQSAIASITSKVDSNGQPIMQDPNGRSYDLYAILTILHRANVL